MKHLIAELETATIPDASLLTRLLAVRGPDAAFLRSAALECLFRHVGSAVYFRGLVEMTNVCAQNCYYCGIRKDASVERYRLGEDDIVAAARLCNQLGFGSVVLQSGEIASDAFVDFVCRAVKSIRRETQSELLPDGLGITLSIGVLTQAQYQSLFDAGAHRYLLRIETSNEALFKAIHPPEQSLAQRYRAIKILQEVGFQTGTGVMIGLPGQSLEMLAHDILMFRQLDIDMVGMGPFLPAEATPLGNAAIWSASERFELGLNMIALTRLVCKDINIASTTALEGLHPKGRLRGLQCGANVAMPNLTPLEKQIYYKLYDDKPMAQSVEQAVGAIEKIGRHVALNDFGDPQHFFRRIK